MAKGFLYVLATIGALSLIILIAIIIFSIMVFSNLNDGLLKNVFDGKEGEVKRALIMGSLDETQKYTVLHSDLMYDEAEFYDEAAIENKDDIREYYCIQLEKFEPKEKGWQSQPIQDSLFIQAQQRVIKKENISQCFGEGVNINDASIQRLIHSIKLTGQRKITETTALFFQASTKRLMYATFYAYEEE